MLIKRDVLDRIVTGEIDTLFRKQKRPTVKAGGTLRTAVGMLLIRAVDEVDEQRITFADAGRSGAGSIDEVRAALALKPDGTVYRVRVEYGGDDPRLALRERSAIGDDEMAGIVASLDRFDLSRSGEGWTRATLELIDAHPHLRAPDLAAVFGRETTAFKTDVRKLKELGLTISHSPGYELSPRGHTVLDHLAGERVGEG